MPRSRPNRPTHPANPILTCTDNETYTIKLTAADLVHPPVISQPAAVEVTNAAPTIALSSLDSVDEGSLFTLSLGAVIDPGDYVNLRLRGGRDTVSLLSFRCS